jgi:Mce-associated membrane protein
MTEPQDEVPETEERPDEEKAPEAGGRRAPSRILLAWVLSVLLVLALAGTAVAAIALRGQDSREEGRTAMTRAGRQMAVDFMTYKYQTWDADVQRVLANATGPFKQQFSSTAASLKTQVVQNKASSQGEVLEAGIISMDSDSGQLLIVVDAAIANTSAPNGQLRHLRVKLDMVREGDRWLTADLQFVG